MVILRSAPPLADESVLVEVSLRLGVVRFFFIDLECEMWLLTSCVTWLKLSSSRFLLLEIFLVVWRLMAALSFLRWFLLRRFCLSVSLELFWVPVVII